MSEGEPKSVAQTGEEPTIIIEIGGKKFEVGPNLGDLRWRDISGNLAKLNLTLKAGEGCWRILTEKECRELNDRRLNWSSAFTSKSYYWTCTDYFKDDAFAWIWDARSGNMVGQYKNFEATVQCVREV